MIRAVCLFVLILLPACAAAPTGLASPKESFAADRAAILAMAGSYDVTFDFRETVPLAPGYGPAEDKLTGGTEVVQVIEDRGDFISLQHVLVADHGGTTFPLKHWRQDWKYAPETVLTFLGGQAWRLDEVPPSDAVGAWSQSVYQVDDSPRYAGVAPWRHGNGISAWEAERRWRPLPRRDMTTRDDYHAVDAVNRHVITPAGWVHEQDNLKLDLSGETPRALVREAGLNTYTRRRDGDAARTAEIAAEYLAATETYWAAIRRAWADYEIPGVPYGLDVVGESAGVYMPLLALGDAVARGETGTETAIAEAEGIIAAHVTTDLPPLRARLRPNATEETD